MNTANN
jgi:calmodulin